MLKSVASSKVTYLKLKAQPLSANKKVWSLPPKANMFYIDYEGQGVTTNADRKCNFLSFVNIQGEEAN